MPERQHEPDLTSVRRLWAIMLATVGLVLISSLAVWLVLDHYSPPPFSSYFQEGMMERPGPRLQSNPPQDLAELNQQMTDRLTSTGWISQEEGIVHIPIDQAMTLLVERGLPLEGSR